VVVIHCLRLNGGGVGLAAAAVAVLLVPGRRRLRLLLDLALEEAAALCLVDDLDVVVDGHVRPVCRVPVVIAAATREVHIGRAAHYLHRRVPVLVREARTKDVDAGRLRFWTSGRKSSDQILRLN
jgi:hypothetical protein